MKSNRPEQPAPVSEDKKRIILVDDHPIVCEGLAQRINAERDLMVCAQAPNPHAALQAIETQRPDLAIVDISLGGSSGIELLKDIKVRFPKLLLIVLSMHDEKLYAERCLRAGARAYVMKQEPPEMLLQAIRQVLRGQVFLSERVTKNILNRIGGNVPQGEVTSPVEQLSDRELEVFHLIGDGYGTQEIATRLHLSIKTVASHREHIKQKLNLRSGDELARFAIHWGRHDTPEGTHPLPAASPRPPHAKPARPRPSRQQIVISRASGGRPARKQRTQHPTSNVQRPRRNESSS